VAFGIASAVGRAFAAVCGRGADVIVVERHVSLFSDVIPMGIAFASAVRKRAQAVRLDGLPLCGRLETPGLAYLLTRCPAR
jgi:hypothetical protein